MRAADGAFATVVDPERDDSGVRSVTPDDPPDCAVAGRFRLHGIVARGAMGAVYRATDMAEGGTVAVKVPFGAGWSAIGGASEGLALASVSAPSIPRCVAEGDASEPYLAMGLCEGAPLLERLRDAAPFSPQLALGTARRAAAALAAVHLAGWVHQDVKPGNFVVGTDGRLSLVDFGLASPIGGVSAGIAGNRWIGTPGYLAPEQLTTERTADPRADVFALGCITFECITGRRAFPRTPESISAGDWSGARHPTLDTADLPEWARPTVDAMTAVRPEARPHDALAVLVRWMTLDPTVAARLVGREAVVEAAVRAAYRANVLVVGGPGAGTTSAALGAATVLAEVLAPSSVVLLRCNPRARAAKGAHGLALADALRSAGHASAASLLEGQPVTVELAGGSPSLVIVVDDLPFCDRASLDRLRVLAGAGLARIIGTARTGTPLEDGLDVVALSDEQVAPASPQPAAVDREVLMAASLFGSAFDARAVTKWIGTAAAPTLGASLERLEQSGVLRRGAATRWAFARTSAWEAAIRGLPASRLASALADARRVEAELTEPVVEVSWVRRASGACT